MSELSKSERRKEQNRRAQANHRKKRQQRFQFLEQQLGFLEHLTNSASDGSDLDFVADGVQTQAQLSSPDLPGPDQARFVATTLPSLSPRTVDAFPPTGSPFDASCLSENSLYATSATHGSCVDASWSNALVPSYPSSAQDRPAQSCQRAYPDKPSCYVFDALASNAKLLGYPNEALIKATSGSKFFSPLSVLDTSALPEVFQPTMAQLTYDHHPYIDCIPLPDLRSRMVLAVSHKPPLAAHLELFYDVLLGGLSSGPDPQDGSQWSMNEAFTTRWKSLLSSDIGTLLAQTLSSNPPMRIVFAPGG